MLNPFRCAVLAVLTATLLSIPTLAQQAPPSADTFVNSATPNVNYGSSVVLAVGSGTTSYMKFNLSAVPAGSTVSKAMLRVYVDAVISGGQFDVYNLPSSPAWTERTLKFSSPSPPLGSSATGGHPISVTSASMNNFLLIDVTTTVQGWLADPTSNNGLALGAVGGTGWFSFDSKESFLTAHQPELEIVTTGPGGGQGPQGPQGPQGFQGVAGPVGPVGPAGPQGATGNTGPLGPMGLPGSAGPAGPAGTNGTGFNFRNAFVASASYAVNDVTTFNGATYVATFANAGPSNPTPDINTAAWTLMAAEGAAGATGAAGPAGPQGIKGDTGLTGAPGVAGPIGPLGAIGYTGPQGMMGLPGPTGPAGPAGTDGTGFNFRNAFDNNATYAVNDVATYKGATYVATAVNAGPSNPTPDTNTTAWTLMAAQGAAGATGANGATGTTGPIGPQGNPGPAGPPGPGLTSINSLSGLSCFSGQPGVTALTFASNGVATLTCNLVGPPKLAQITITPPNPSDYAGTTQQFVATGLYADGSTQNITAAATWSSSISAVATIGANTGLAYVLGIGATTVSATLANINATANLTVPTLTSDGINNTFATAAALGTLNCGVSTLSRGTTFPAGTEDWLVFTGGSTLFTNCSHAMLTLTASSGIQFDVDNAGGTALYSTQTTPVSLPATGTYYIRIYGANPLVTGTWSMAVAVQ